MVISEDKSKLNVSMKQYTKYLEFTVAGSYDLTDAIDKFPLVITACRQTGFSKALIDYRQITGEILATEELLYAYSAGGYYKEHLSSGGQPLKLAFVANKILSRKIGEVVGEAVGIEVLVTSDLQEAVDWLCEAN